MITITYNGTATCDDCGAEVGIMIQTDDNLTGLTSHEYINGDWRHTSSSASVVPDLKVIWPDGWIVDSTITCPKCAGVDGCQEPEEPVEPPPTDPGLWTPNTTGEKARTQWERMLDIDYDPEVMCQHIRDLQTPLAESGVFINELGPKAFLTCMRCNKNFPITAVKPGSILEQFHLMTEKRKKTDA